MGLPALGVPAQAVIGGVTVLTDLNPWIVSFHLLVSLAMVGLAVVLLRRLDEGDGPPVLLLHGHPQTHVIWHRVANTADYGSHCFVSCSGFVP